MHPFLVIKVLEGSTNGSISIVQSKDVIEFWVDTQWSCIDELSTILIDRLVWCLDEFWLLGTKEDDWVWNECGECDGTGIEDESIDGTELSENPHLQSVKFNEMKCNQPTNIVSCSFSFETHTHRKDHKMCKTHRSRFSRFWGVGECSELQIIHKISSGID